MVCIDWVKMYSQGHDVNIEQEKVQQLLVFKCPPHVPCWWVRKRSFHVDDHRQEAGEASRSPESVPAVGVVQYFRHRLKYMKEESDKAETLTPYYDNSQRVHKKLSSKSESS